MHFIDEKSKMPQRRHIQQMSKSELRSYLEQRGFCWYAEESKAELLDTALSDYDEEFKERKEA